MVNTTVVRTADGREVTFCQWGLADGRPVFFLHGTPGGRLLRHVGGEYERTGLRVITYDRPGYGRSTRLPGRDIAHAAGDVARIADTLGLSSFGVVGVSGGGPYALAVAALLPDRVTRCATIVAGAPYGAEGLDFFDGMDEATRADWQARVAGGEGYLLESYTAMLGSLATFEAEPGDLPPEVHQMLVEAFRDGLAPGHDGYIDDCLAELRPYGFRIRDVAAPTRIMLARQDDSVPAGHGDWLMQHLPQGELVWVDGGHFGPRLKPEEHLLAWLGGQPARPGHEPTASGL
jgi:pimeloyl-ACP methyl ester carboxylesterase